MKKIFPEAPDVPQNIANRGIRIIEKHLRQHHVNRVSELPEEAKVRLYRDLRFFFEGGNQSSGNGSDKQRFSLRRFLSRMWEGIEDFLSASESNRDSTEIQIYAWAFFGESAKLAVVPWINGHSACDDSC